jgi:hypothetical protein
MSDLLILIALLWAIAMAIKGQYHWCREMRQAFSDHRRIMREIETGERYPPLLRKIDGGAR